MGEVLPVLGGLLAGSIIAYNVRAWRSRLASMIAASVAVGVLAAWVSGELAESFAFLAIDIPGAFLAVLVAVLTCDRLGLRGADKRRPA